MVDASLPVDSYNCRRMVVHQGALWYAAGHGDTGTARPQEIRRLVNHDGVRDIQYGFGLDVGDGVAADALGELLWMESAGEHLFISVGGSASGLKARIMDWYVNEYGEAGWHTVVKNATEAVTYPWIGLGANDYLYWAEAGTGHVAKGVQYATLSPSAGVSTPRAGSGFIDLPDIDFGMPADIGVAVKVSVDAVNLSATNSNEYINVDFGTDGAVRTTTDLGDMLSGTKSIAFGSGAGVSATSIAVRMNLHQDGGSTTDDPILRATEIEMYKQPPERERFEFTIDIQASADIEGLSPEEVITNIQTARDLTTFPALVYGNLTSTNVVVKRLVWLETPEKEGMAGVAADTESKRVGACHVFAEEVA